MMTLLEIQIVLEDRRIDMVARGTGLHYNTVRRIRDGDDENPTLKTMTLLSDYLSGDPTDG